LAGPPLPAEIVFPAMAIRKSPRSVAVATRKRPAKQAAKPTRPAPKSRAKSPAAIASGPPLYSVHPGVAMLRNWISNLKQKTGCSLEEWIAHIQLFGLKDEKECRAWLVARHKLGPSAAAWLAAKACGDSSRVADADPVSYLAACPGYVERMYAGAKATLRPIHDALVKVAKEIAADVKVCPCQTAVPLFRRHVFAEIKPASYKRIDLGLALGDEPFTSRLQDTLGRAKKHRITHKVAIGSLADIDLQVKRWLKQAYERDGS
jgi:hypothetical protein